MEYSGNSHKVKDAKDEKKKELAPVVRGNVSVKKDNVGKKFADTFLADNVHNVGNYMLFDVVVPAITDTIVDALTGAISMLFKGSPTPRRSKSSGKTNYSSFSRGNGSRRRYDDDEPRRYSRDRYGLLDIVFESRGDALEVRDCLLEVLDKYKIVSISDYYDLCKIGDQAKSTDYSYGWEDFDDDIQVKRDRDGYRLILPKPEPLN